MINASRVRSLILLLGLAAAVGGISHAWHGGSSRSGLGSASSLRKTASEPGPAGALDGLPSSLIIDYRDDVSDAELAATPEHEEPISGFSSQDRLYRVRFASPAAAAEAAARLRLSPRIESVDWDVEASIPPDEQAGEVQAADDGSMQAECGTAAGDERGAFPKDPCFRYQWHLRQVGLPDAWKLGQGKGAVVAVIDTGVSRVPDLAQTTFVPGYNFIADNDKADDDHGHGTHVAGTIAQATNNKLGVAGVAYGASIMPLKVLSASGSGSVAAIAQAIRFAANHGAQVINMSLGGPMSVGSIGSAVKYARGKGVTIVAAAGNDGRGRVSFPARYPGVIAVAATQFDEATTFYSNWGPEIDIAAPGGNVRLDDNDDGKPDGVLQNTVVPRNVGRTDYLWFMGTSMASPHVAGVAALIVGAGVTKPDAVEEMLLSTARKPKGNSSPAARIDDRYGAGVVDAGAALKKAKVGRGAGELGLGTLLALLGVSFVSRRGRRVEKLGPGFVLALLGGSSGLFLLPLVLPSLFGAGGVLNLLGSGALDGVDGLLRPGLRGSPLLWSALLPLTAIGFLYGVGRLRGVLAGLGFGVAGALLFAAIAASFDVRAIPDFLDRTWLAANAALSALLATAVIRR